MEISFCLAVRAKSSSASMDMTHVLTPSGKACAVRAAHSESLAEGKLMRIQRASP